MFTMLSIINVYRIQICISNTGTFVKVETIAGSAELRGPPPVLAVGADDIFWVSQLHAGLVKEGFCAGEDEMEEWIFGDGTQSALLTFQASALALAIYCHTNALRSPPAK